jgi:hypothetical protein
MAIICGSLNLLVFIKISSIIKPEKILLLKPVNCRGDYHPLFEQNQKLKNEFSRTGSHGDFVHMATMSEGMFFELHKQGRMDTSEDIRKVINDSNYAGIKVNDWKA